jgi:hypothetical protein
MLAISDALIKRFGTGRPISINTIDIRSNILHKKRIGKTNIKYKTKTQLFYLNRGQRC